MTIEIKHAFTSLKGDGGDATLVRPSNWNAAHSTSMATGRVVGRLTAGVGAFEEIPITAAGAAVLAANDASPYGFVTGDVKFRLINAAVPAGWIGITGTIGNAASGATNRANADTLALFTALYDGGAPDSTFPVSGGRTGSALNDFNAGKTMSLAGLHGRVFGNAYGAWQMGALVGEAAHTLTQSELPAVGLSVSVSGSVSGTIGSNQAVNQGIGGSTTGGGGFAFNYPTANGGITSSGTMSGSMSGGTSAMGSNAPHNNYQPTAAVIALVKL